jgi:hypothetical protein
VCLRSRRVCVSDCCARGADQQYLDWWGNREEMRYETQADLLRLLNSVAQHYAAVSLSLTVTRSFDATRLCTLGAITAVCISLSLSLSHRLTRAGGQITDTILRIAACDIPSQLSLHYNGTAEGPVKAFAFDCSHFAIESEYSRFHEPCIAAVRAAHRAA